MEHTEKLKNSKEIIAYIAECFPKCFILEGEAKPLKIGIFQELAERLDGDVKVSKTQLRAALRQYTSSWRYLHSAKVGAVRVDLDGNECGEIEQEHIDHAQATLAESKARVQARRKEQAKKNREENKEQVKATTKTGVVKTQKNTAKMASHRTDPKTTKTSSVEQKQVVETRALNAEELAVGLAVNVNMGKGNMAATIVEINKDDVRVQLSNGLQMVMKVEHLRA